MKPIELSQIEQQIFTVAKGHYDKYKLEPYKKDKIQILEAVIMQLCNLPSVSVWELHRLVSSCFLKHVKLSHQEDAMRWMFVFGFSHKDTITIQEMIKWMLGAIGTIQIVKDTVMLFDYKPEVLDIAATLTREAKHD